MPPQKNMPPRSFRLVCQPEEFPLVEQLLREEGFRFQPEPFSPYCRQLLYEPFPLGSSIAAFFGYIYIQDRSSMLPPLALNPPPGSAILDMAASPGSKTSFLCQLTGRAGLVTANEPNQARLRTLATNLRQLNLAQAVTMSSQGEQLNLRENTWEYILLDPPCSGWGTTRKHPAASKIWRGSKIRPLAALQRQLLKRAAALLKPGGKLLYSTCTTNPAENEEQIRFAINELGLETVPIEPFPGFVFAESAALGLLVDEAASKAQGFYLCLLKKPGAAREDELAESVNPQWRLLDKSSLDSDVCDTSLLPPGLLAVFNSQAFFLPGPALRMLPESISWTGCVTGKICAGHFIPEPRMRLLLPRRSAAPRIISEDVAELRRLLSGMEHKTGIKAPYAGLWHRDLPLGICRIKNGRAIASFK